MQPVVREVGTGVDAGPRASRIVLVGNPNVGKSVLFSHLTRSYATVSNYPGTTVELMSAPGRGLPGAPAVIDTPGTNSLTPLSEDERVTRDVLLESARGVPGAGPPRIESAENGDTIILQIGDARNLRRTLLITLELAELELPFLLVLNMMDEARDRNIRIDVPRLESLLGVPVVPTVATRGEGLDTLAARLDEARIPGLLAGLPADLERAVGEIETLMPEVPRGRRGLAAMMLAGDADLISRMLPRIGLEAAARIQELSRGLSTGVPGSLAWRLTRARLRSVDRILASCTKTAQAKPGPRETLNRMTVHPVWGVPIVLLILTLTYYVVGVFGAGIAVDFLETHVFGGFINPLATRLAALLPFAWLTDLLVGEYGIVTMALTYSIAIVLPIVFFFFVIFGFLEDSGYLPRLAIMLNRPMQAIGLNGKAVLPMVLGLGCDTMATLTTRILETKRERILVTLLLALGVPCSAQLAVVLALTSRISIRATLVWGAVVLLTILAVGWLAARVLPGDRSDFVLEIPPLRVPKAMNILNKTLARLEWYLKEAVPLFVLGTLLLFVLARTGLLRFVERAAAPLVTGVLSLPQEMAGAFVVGFLRRDYGAVYLGEAAGRGELSALQIVVALVTLTLFVPCVANFFIMIKERGFRTAAAMVAFIVPFAFLVGGLLNWTARILGGLR